MPDIQPEMTQIKASAGSGKTYTLTQEFLKHLSGCKAQVRRDSACSMMGPEEDWRSVMAITFTNAAASEMQDRVLRVLKERALCSAPEGSSAPFLTQREAREWLERIMHDKASLNISTIDSLLNLIVRMSALTENLPPDFTPVFTTSEILDPYWEAVTNEAWQGDRHLKALIARICEMAATYDERNTFQASSIITKKLTRLMPLLFTERLNDLTPEEAFQTSDGQGLLPGLRKTIHECMQLLLAADGTAPEGAAIRLHKNCISALEKACREYAAELGGCVQEATLADYAKLRLSKKCFDSAYFRKDKLPVTTKSGPAPDSVHEAYATLVDSVRSFLPLEALYRQSRICQPLLELARLIFERYERNQQAEGLVPNDRIPIMVERILSGEYGVAEALCRMGTRISHFLVDEFQDTSRDHWAALKPLVAEALARGGSFSWVGDVKQAIYGFRGGDSQLFDDISRDASLTRMLQSGVHRETLAANWRSRKEIIDFNNALFAPLDDRDLCRKVLEAASSSLDLAATCRQAPSYCADAEAPDETLIDYMAGKMAEAYAGAAQGPSPRTRDGGSVSLVLFGADEQKGNDGGTGAAEAEDDDIVPADEQCTAVHKLCLKSHATHPWSDLLVLVRTNRQAMALARFLSQQGIPVITENSLLLSDHPLIVQTIALLTFLRAPEDDIAFWTVMSGSIMNRDAEDRPFACERFHLDESLLALSRERRVRHTLDVENYDPDDLPEDLNEDPDHGSGGTDETQGSGGSGRSSGSQAPNRLNSPGRTLAQAWSEAYPQAWNTLLVPLMDACGSITPYDLVAEWYDREDVDARFPEARPFVRRFLEILHTSRQRGIRSVGAFLDYWAEHGQEEKVPMPEGMDAVRIMTTHKAKGLQAPIVIVPWTSARTSNFPGLEVVEYYPEDGSAPLRALCPHTKVFPSWTARVLKDAFEAVNRFYVAFTRAEEELCILVSAKPQGDGALLHCLLARAGEALPAPVPWAQVQQELDATLHDLQEQDPVQTQTGPTGADLPERPKTPELPETEAVQGGTASVPRPLWDGTGRTALAASQDWRPMDWMPRLRLHFDYQDESHPRDRAREEGILVHACLEELARLPASVRRDEEAFAHAREQALQERIKAAPWLGEGDFADRAREELAWFAALDERCHWLDHGLPEQSICTSRGRMLRTDLLVLPHAENHLTGPLVVEYKHGLCEEPFLSDYHAQVLAYLRTLVAAGDKASPRPMGCIVYLRSRKLHLVLHDGSSPTLSGRVTGAEAPAVLLDEADVPGLIASISGLAAKGARSMRAQEKAQGKTGDKVRSPAQKTAQGQGKARPKAKAGMKRPGSRSLPDLCTDTNTDANTDR